MEEALEVFDRAEPGLEDRADVGVFALADVVALLARGVAERARGVERAET